MTVNEAAAELGGPSRKKLKCPCGLWVDLGVVSEEDFQRMKKVGVHCGDCVTAAIIDYEEGDWGMTVKEVAIELGIGSSRVRKLIGAGRLRAKITPRGYVIRPKDLDAVRVRKPGRPWPKAAPQEGPVTI